MAQMLPIVQAYDRALIEEIPADDAAALERKLALAHQAFRNRKAWLKPHERSGILRRAAALLQASVERFATLIAREGGKPFVDAMVEATRAVDGLHNAADELRNFA